MNELVVTRDLQEVSGGFGLTYSILVLSHNILCIFSLFLFFFTFFLDIEIILSLKTS